MMIRVLMVVALAGCTSGPGASGDDDDDTADAGGGGGIDAAPGDPSLVPFTIEPFDVEGGSERQVCKVVNIPDGVTIDVVKLTSTMVGESHHFNAYKVLDADQFAPATPAEAAVHDCEPASGQLDGTAAYFYGASLPEKTLELPAEVAFHFEPGQRIVLEQHVINAGDGVTQGGVSFELHGAAPGATIAHRADIGWFGNWSFFLQSGTSSSTTMCAVDYPIEIFGLASHTHSLGVNFEISTMTAQGTQSVYESTDWRHPLYQTYAPTLVLEAGDALQWTCTWNNTSGGLVLPGKNSTDEMCIAFAYFYARDSLEGAPLNCNEFPF
jgi:hypothetical protein